MAAAWKQIGFIRLPLQFYRVSAAMAGAGGLGPQSGGWVDARTFRAPSVIRLAGPGGGNSSLNGPDGQGEPFPS